MVKFCHQRIGKKRLLVGLLIASPTVMILIYNYGFFDEAPVKEGSKNFLYLTQVPECLNEMHLKSDSLWSGNDFDVLVLSFKKLCKATYPRHIRYIASQTKTSWTTGRNFLYRYARRHSYYTSKNYTYYILMDGDIQLVNNKYILDTNNFTEEIRSIAFNPISPWRKFEEFLLDYLPAVGMVENGIEIGHFMRAVKQPVQAYYSYIHYDAQFNAFHKDAVDSLLPYNDTWEETSIWVSQQIMICSTYFRYNGHVLFFLPVNCLNTEHTQYAKGFLPMSMVCEEEVAKAPVRMVKSNWFICLMNIGKGIVIDFCSGTYGYVAPPKTKIIEYKYFNGTFDETSST